MIAMLIANLVNALIGYVLIYGHYGFEAMGAEGAVVATGVARWIAAGGTIGFAWFMADHARYGVRGSFLLPWSEGATLRRLGLPFGIAQGVETLSFQAMIVFAGWLGATALGGYQIAMNMVIVVFMTAIGVATATGVRVGNAVGRGGVADRDRAGAVGVALNFVVMGAFALAFVVLDEAIVGFYSEDPAVIAACLPVVAVAAVMLVFDGAQTVLVSALRGAGDAWMPTAIQALAFWGVMTPVGYWLAFRAGHGAPGLMAGALAGVAVASVLLGWRLVSRAGRPVRRL
jgi:MATE family multidrug resistance protein